MPHGIEMLFHSVWIPVYPDGSGVPMIEMRMQHCIVRLSVCKRGPFCGGFLPRFPAITPC